MTEDLNKLTVAELRDEVRRVYTYEVDTSKVSIPTGLSKMRKADLVKILTDFSAKSSLPVAVVGETSVNEAELQDFIGDVMQRAAKGVRALGDALGELQSTFTAAARQELNEAKYRGRYAGKSVQLVTGHDRVHGADIPRIVTGTIVDRVHRESDPLNKGDGSGLLLLVIKHGDLPRVTMHRAEDVAV